MLKLALPRVCFLLRLLAAGPGRTGALSSSSPRPPTPDSQHPKSGTLWESEFLHLTCDFSRKLKPVHRQERNLVYVTRDAL